MIIKSHKIRLAWHCICSTYTIITLALPQTRLSPMPLVVRRSHILHITRPTPSNRYQLACSDTLKTRTHINCSMLNHIIQNTPLQASSGPNYFDLNALVPHFLITLTVVT